MKLWVDDVRPAPQGYLCAGRSVNEVKRSIEWVEESYSVMERQFYDRRAEWSDVEFYVIELIDIDHDAGDYASDGGDYIKLLDWLEETGRNYPIRIHSMNPVGVANMRAIIQKNGWTEVR